MTPAAIEFHYQGEQVRTSTLAGEPAFVLADIARILGYRSASDAGRVLRDRHKGYADVRTLGGIQTMVVVTEAGLNRLVMRSNASNAEVVQDWLSDEVLPSIRRTGAYVAPQSVEQQLASAVVLAQGIIEQRDKQIAVLTPKAEAWSALADAEGDYSVADAAKILQRAGVNTGPQRLFGQLADLRWIFRAHDRRWRAYQAAVESGYLAELPQSHRHPRTDEVVIDAPQIRLTLRGIERLRVRLGVLKAVAS